MSPLKVSLMLAMALAAGCASAPEELTASTSPPAVAAVADEIDPVVVSIEEINIPPGSVIRCREMLKRGSNVIVPICMSRDAWKRYEREEAREAAAFVRMLQGSAFR